MEVSKDRLEEGWLINKVCTCIIMLWLIIEIVVPNVISTIAYSIFFVNVKMGMVACNGK